MQAGGTLTTLEEGDDEHAGNDCDAGAQRVSAEVAAANRSAAGLLFASTASAGGSGLSICCALSHLHCSCMVHLHIVQRMCERVCALKAGVVLASTGDQQRCGVLIGAAEGNREMQTRHQGFGAYDVPFLDKKGDDSDGKDEVIDHLTRCVSVHLACTPWLSVQRCHALPHAPESLEGYVISRDALSHCNT
jgi:hypothetical protein